MRTLRMRLIAAAISSRRGRARVSKTANTSSVNAVVSSPEVDHIAPTAVQKHFPVVAKHLAKRLAAKIKKPEPGTLRFAVGGAEVFDDRVHDEAYKGKIRAGKWLDVHRAAHEIGLVHPARRITGLPEHQRGNGRQSG